MLPSPFLKTSSISHFGKSGLNRRSCNKHSICNLTKERTRVNWQCLVENSDALQAKTKMNGTTGKNFLPGGSSVPLSRDGQLVGKTVHCYKESLREGKRKHRYHTTKVLTCIDSNM